MTTLTAPRTLNELMETVPSITDHLFRNAPKAALTI